MARNGTTHKQFCLVEAIGDQADATAVTTGTAADFEEVRILRINQDTTVDATLTLAAPANGTEMFLCVHNEGTELFTMYGIRVPAQAMAWFSYNSVVGDWLPDVGPSNIGELPQVLVPTATNALPALSPAPTVGTSPKFFVNGARSTGISSDAAGALTVVQATVGYPIATWDRVLVDVS